MKKLLSVLLVLAMLLGACALAETVDLTGEWYLTELAMGDTSVDPSALGMNITITLNGDGTAVLVSTYGDEEETQEGTWAQTEAGVEVVTGENPTALLLEDGKLKLDMGEEGAMIFGREKTEAPALPAAVAAESEDAFLGTWKITSVSMMGLVVPAEVAEINVTMTVEAGKVTLLSGEEPQEIPTTFADGVLTASEPDMGEIKLSLCEDGTVSLEVSMGEAGQMIMYFTRAE